MDWTEETIARLRAMWDEGLSTAEIGRRLGVTKNAVVGKAHRLTLPPRPSPIRRTPGGEVRAPRRAKHRTSGPTLTVLATMAATPRPVAVAPVPVEQPRPLPVLRSVPSTPRPTARTVACCWPIGEPGKPSFRFCSDTATTGKPYCAQHAAIAYVKVRDRREDAA